MLSWAVFDQYAQQMEQMAPLIRQHSVTEKSVGSGI